MAGRRGSWNYWENESQGAPSRYASQRARPLGTFEVWLVRLMPVLVVLLLLAVEPAVHQAVLGMLLCVFSFARLGAGQRRQVLGRRNEP